ncbi:ANTAR domain-containing protein [Streptomyces sp. NPDC051214]|uniref:ANTAR domain-containing protein n=1 Tax=Streptomyces sp. NPDC051214 TaxID=3155282 RepID=UPI00341D8496
MGTASDLFAVLQSLHPSGNDPGGLIGSDPKLCAQALLVDGIAVSATTDSGLSELLWSTAGASTWLEDLQFTLGQGPALEAAATCRPILVADLSRLSAERWPQLCPEVVALGVGAIFCFPLSVGSACLGTMTLQRAAAGPLPDAAMTDAWLVANALIAILLQSDPQQGQQQAAFATASGSSDFYRAAVHNASGMVSVQADVSLAQALLRLRAHAYGHGRPLLEVAEDVVARRLVFHNDDNGPDIPAGEGTEGP